MKTQLTLYAGAFFLLMGKLGGVHAASDEIRINQSILGFKIPDFSQFLSFAIRLFFVIAGLIALFYMLQGAMKYVTGKVDDAQKQIQAAVIGVILIIATLSIIAALEQVVFKKSVCFGITCPLTIPGILNPIDRKNDMDGDGLANKDTNEFDTDGDGYCNDGGDHEGANPGNSPEDCSGPADGDDDDDNVPDSQDVAPNGDSLDPTLPNR